MPDEPKTLDPAARPAATAGDSPAPDRARPAGTTSQAPQVSPTSLTSRVSQASPSAPAARTLPARRFLVPVTVGLVLAALNLRPAITSLGALLEEVSEGLHMSGTVAGVLTSVPPLCFAVFGITAPRLARRFGPAAVVCAGMAAIFTGLVLRPSPAAPRPSSPPAPSPSWASPSATS